MDERTLTQIREALMARYQRIEKLQAQETAKVDGDTAEPLAEIIDIAQSLEQIGRDISLAEQERRELTAIQHALTKMSSGNFGVCEDCGDDIPVKRLMIVPSARLCATCQAYEEKQNSRTRPMAAAG